MAAALACGQDAVVSHRSAAELWQLLKPRDGPVHITVPNRSGRARRAGIRLHRRRAFDSAQATRRWRIPVTTPARTISDLRRNLPAYEVRHAVRQAEVLGLPLGEMSSDRTRSDLERDFLKICRRHQLPAPEVNVELGTYEADFLWRDRRIIVETDSYRYHRGWQAFKDDHARDLELRQRGFEVFRFSEAQINEEAERVASFLRGVLASRPHRVGADGE
jgi:very-short-patch-repair endonuclease